MIERKNFSNDFFNVRLNGGFKMKMSTGLNNLAPIVITGRGGSGTRLLSRLVQQAQIFLGNKLNRQGDSLEWVKLNRKFLFEGINIKNGTFDTFAKSLLIEKSKNILSQLPENHCYKEWGFKLPEMLFMLPELFDTFPQAKLIHLVRHPVSTSLRRTHITSRMDNPVGQWVLPQAYRYLSLNEQLIEKYGDEINNAISWKFQLDIINKFAKKQLNENNYLVIKFEELIKNPANVYNTTMNFIGRQFDNLDVPDILINENRALIKNTDLKTESKIWEICGEAAELLGYK